MSLRAVQLKFSTPCLKRQASLGVIRLTPGGDRLEYSRNTSAAGAFECIDWALGQGAGLHGKYKLKVSGMRCRSEREIHSRFRSDILLHIFWRIIKACTHWRLNLRFIKWIVLKSDPTCNVATLNFTFSFKC